MIEYQVLKNNDSITHVSVKGHALYDRSGKDIVCASVSTAIIVTVNALEVLGQNQTIDFVIEEGNFKLDVKNSNDIVKGLLNNLEYTLDELKKQYPKYIKNQKER